MRTLTICIALCAAAFSASAQEFDQAKLSNIPEVMKKLVDDNQISGSVTCVATRDKIVALDATGLANIKTNEPMKPDTIFWIASMTKPLTGASIMMLQEQGKLSFDDPVSKYIPEFANIKTPSGKPANLTIKHLMTHTSGLAEISGPKGHTSKDLAALIPLFVDKPTQFEPGTEWRYCSDPNQHPGPDHRDHFRRVLSRFRQGAPHRSAGHEGHDVLSHRRAIETSGQELQAIRN